LVKWRSLQYEDSTWELEEDVDPEKIAQFVRFNKVPPKEQWKVYIKICIYIYIYILQNLRLNMQMFYLSFIYIHVYVVIPAKEKAQCCSLGETGRITSLQEQ